MDEVCGNRQNKVVIRIDVNVAIYAGGDPAIRRSLDQILAELKAIKRGTKEMTRELDDLTTRVSEIENVGDSAIALLNGLKSKLDEAIASGDPGAIQALSDRLGAQAQELADAITANTPVEPTE